MKTKSRWRIKVIFEGPNSKVGVDSYHRESMTEAEAREAALRLLFEKQADSVILERWDDPKWVRPASPEMHAWEPDSWRLGSEVP